MVLHAWLVKHTGSGGPGSDSVAKQAFLVEFGYEANIALFF